MFNATDTISDPLIVIPEVPIAIMVPAIISGIPTAVAILAIISAYIRIIYVPNIKFTGRTNRCRQTEKAYVVRSRVTTG